MNEIIDAILSVIDINAVLQLPWYLGLGGLAVAALLAWSALWAMLRLRIVMAAMRLALALVIVIVLSQWGQDIADTIDSQREETVRLAPSPASPQPFSIA